MGTAQKGWWADRETRERWKERQDRLKIQAPGTSETWPSWQRRVQTTAENACQGMASDSLCSSEPGATRRCPRNTEVPPPLPSTACCVILQLQKPERFLRHWEQTGLSPSGVGKHIPRTHMRACHRAVVLTSSPDHNHLGNVVKVQRPRSWPDPRSLVPVSAAPQVILKTSGFENLCHIAIKKKSFQ